MSVEQLILPQFPLGSVLFPSMVLPLHVFEPRFRQLLDDIDPLGNDLFEDDPRLDTGPVDAEQRDRGAFGVVLIERGSEVGGGELRTNVGTIATILRREPLPDGRSSLLCVGTERFRVDEWMPDDPYPRARIHRWPDQPGPPCTAELFQRASDAYDLCRSVFERHGIEVGTRPGFHPEPRVATFQIAALSPLGELDRQDILEAPDEATRCERLADHLESAAAVLEFRLSGD